MSLTSHLNDRYSPVRAYLTARFGLTEQLRQGASRCAEVRALLGLGLLRRQAVRAPLSPASQRYLVGMALDYRMRFMWAPSKAEDLVAFHGASAVLGRAAWWLTGHGQGHEQPSFDNLAPVWRPAAMLAKAFFADVNWLVAMMKPARRRLTNAEEILLARYCAVLAYWEQVYRLGPRHDLPLCALSPGARLSDMLGLPDDAVVADIADLAKDAAELASSLWDVPTVLNPTFAGSHAVGGADADLIVDGCLVEIKTVTRWEPADLRQWLHQLVGYVLLDWNDKRRIRQIGLWLPRQRVFQTWPAAWWVFPLSDVLCRSRAGIEFSENELLERLALLRSEMQEVCDRKATLKTVDQVLARSGHERSTVSSPGRTNHATRPGPIRNRMPGVRPDRARSFELVRTVRAGADGCTDPDCICHSVESGDGVTTPRVVWRNNLPSIPLIYAAGRPMLLILNHEWWSAASPNERERALAQLRGREPGRVVEYKRAGSVPACSPRSQLDETVPIEFWPTLIASQASESGARF